jgi:hypothetical protein
MVSVQRVARPLALVLAASAICGAAQAQVPAQAPLAAAPVYGPPIVGLCLFAQAEALTRSQAGVSATQQLAQFGLGIDAELKAQEGAIHNDDVALATQKAVLPPADYQQRVVQMRQRYADLDRTRALRAAQLDVTRKQALAVVGQIVDPSLADTITTHHCSAVFERSATYGANGASDITPAVIQKMDSVQSMVAIRLATPEAAQAAR